MPLPKIPAHGDAARIEQLASGLKREHGTHGAVVQRNPVGRPTGSGTGRRQPPQQQVPLDPRMQQEFGKLAQAEMVRQKWRAIAQDSPTPWVQTMLQMSEEHFEEVAARVYSATPKSDF